MFEAARLNARPNEGRNTISARTRAEKAAALQWASAILFSYFWEVVASGGQQPAVVGGPVAAAVAPGAVPGPPVAAAGAAADLAATASDGSEADDLAIEAESSDGSTIDLLAAGGSPDGRGGAVGSSAVQLIAQTEQSSLNTPANDTDGEGLTGVGPRGSSDTARVPPVADRDEDVERDSNVVPCTPDTRKTPLSYIAEHTARGADNVAVCNPMDPLSPLTPHAVSVTAPLKPYHGRAEVTPSDQEPLVVIDNIPVRLWDLRRVPTTVMLHDEAMNAYIALLERREAAWAAADHRPPRFHFFSTFFFTTLTSVTEVTCNYAAVARWSRDIDFKENEAVLIPINVSSIHWLLAVVYPQRRVVDTYDSLGSASDRTLQCLVQWGQDDTRAHGHPIGRWRTHKVRCRKQENGKDCGAFVLKRTDYISRGMAPERMTGSMDYYRQRMAAELLAMTLL